VKTTTPFFFLIIPLMISCQTPRHADILFKNALFYTADSSFSTAHAMAIENGKILALGDSSNLLKEYQPDTVIDLEGSFVYPGFIDAHCHFYEYGLGLNQIDLTGTTSPEDIIAILRSYKNEKGSGWLIGRGWDQNDWKSKQYPDKSVLDKMFPDIPVYLTRIDGHAAWVNSKALQIAGINEKTSVPGGRILLKNGQPSGILIDNAMGLVSRVITPPEHPEQIDALLAAQTKCFSVGLTTVCNAGLDAPVVHLIDSLQQKGILKMRIYAMLNPTDENFTTYIKKGLYRTDHLTVRSIKLFADGALGSRGALLLEPYTDSSGSRGLQIKPDSFYRNICRKAFRYGYQVNTHCIGDAANRLMLHIYGEILGGPNDLRWRIEHAQVVDPHDFELFSRYHIIPSIQTTHATSDMYWATERLGQKRIHNAYAYHRLLEQNGWIANGSDFPVENINPLFGFYAAVSRKNQKGWPPEGFQKEDALSRQEALRAMTIWAAKAAFEDSTRGSLEPGKFADFVVLKKDLMTVPEADLFRIVVYETWTGGQRVFVRNAADQKDSLTGGK